MPVRPGQLVAHPAAADPRGTRRAGPRPGRRVERTPQGVLAGEDVAAHGQLRAAPGRVDRSGTRRARPVLPRTGHRGGHRARQVQLTGPLTAVPTGKPEGAAGQRRLHLVRGQLGTRLQQQRDGAGDDRGGLRGTAALEQVVADPRGRVGHVDEAARVAQRHDRPAGRHQVGPPGGAAPAAEVGHDVVAGADGAVRVGRADREDVRVVGGIGQRARGTPVAGGDHHDDAGAPRVLDRVGQRVDPVVLAAVGAEGQVDHADRVPRIVVAVRHDPVESGEDLRDVDGAVGGADLDRGEHGAGRDPVDDAGQVGTVPVRVQVPRVAVHAVQGQVGSVDDVVGAQPRYRYHAGVDQRDPDPVAGAPGVPQLVGADHAGDVGDRGGRAVEPPVAVRVRRRGTRCGAGGSRPEDGARDERDGGGGTGPA